MFITQAQAQETAPATASTAVSAPPVPPPGGLDSLLWNVGFVGLLIVMFYFLLIRPQQVRYREHSTMLNGLKKGDKIVLQSGMIATIHDISNDNQEMTVDLYEGVRSRVLRSAIAGRYDDIVQPTAKKK